MNKKSFLLLMFMFLCALFSPWAFAEEGEYLGVRIRSSGDRAYMNLTVGFYSDAALEMPLEKASYIDKDIKSFKVYAHHDSPTCSQPDFWDKLYENGKLLTFTRGKQAKSVALKMRAEAMGRFQLKIVIVDDTPFSWDQTVEFDENMMLQTRDHNGVIKLFEEL